VNAVDAIQTQGAIQTTGRATDVALQGSGSFVMQLGGETLYTRAGSFSLDAQNHLVDATGALLQGWPADATGAIASTDPTALATLTVPAADPSDATALLRSFAIGADGKLNAVYSNGKAMAVGQIAIATFSNPAGLVARGDGHFATDPASGQPTYVTAAPAAAARSPPARSR